MSKIYLSAQFDEDDLMQTISSWDHAAIIDFFKDIELRVADEDFALCVVDWAQGIKKELETGGVSA